jgi:hypothetical protein
MVAGSSTVAISIMPANRSLRRFIRRRRRSGSIVTMLLAFRRRSRQDNNSLERPTRRVRRKAAPVVRRIYGEDKDGWTQPHDTALKTTWRYNLQLAETNYSGTPPRTHIDHARISRYLGLARQPSTILPEIKRSLWLKRSFIPFDAGCRDRFFLSATGFLWTNRDDRLKDGYYMEFGCFGAVTMRMAWKHTRHFLQFAISRF